MNKLIASIIIVFILVLGVLFFQATRSGTSSVLLPSEAIALQKNKSRIRIAGRVSTEKIDYKVEPELVLKFSIHDPEGESGNLPVVYKGIKPDMFASGRDVILDGEIKGGVMVAASLLTQCPSKYEPPTPNK